MARFWASCVALTLAGHAVAAEEPEAERIPARSASPRALGGHVFLPSREVQGPFTVTSFGLRTSAGAAEATAPRHDLDGNVVGTRTHTLAAVGVGLDFDVAVRRDLSLRLQANVLAYSGTSGEAVLEAGATASYGAGLGVTWGRTFGDKRIALVVDTALQPELSVVVANAVINAANTGNFEQGELFTDVTRFENRAGVSFGWGLTPALGLVAEARYLWSRRVSDEPTQERVRRAVLLGGVLDFDLDPLWRVPIGLMASYAASIPTGDGDTVHEAGAGVFYTRRVRLVLGLEVTWRSAELRPGIEPPLDADSFIGTIRLRYYW